MIPTIESTILGYFSAGYTPEQLKKEMERWPFLTPHDPERRKQDLEEGIKLVDELWPKFLSGRDATKQ